MNTKNVKVTMKNSKEQMLRFLEATYPTIKDNKDVAKRVEYTLGNHEKAKKSEVFEVVEEVQEVLVTMPENAEEEKPVPVENEVKKSPKKPKVKKSEPVENEVKAPAKKAKPAVKKTEEKTKKDTKEVTAPTAAKLPETAWPLAMMFPQELTVPNLGKLKAVPETTMEDIVKSLSDGKQ